MKKYSINRVENHVKIAAQYEKNVPKSNALASSESDAQKSYIMQDSANVYSKYYLSRVELELFVEFVFLSCKKVHS